MKSLIAWKSVGLLFLLLVATLPLQAQTGTIRAQFEPGGPQPGNGRGMAFDGTNLYYTIVGDPNIFMVNTTTGALLDTISVVGGTFSGGPLAWDGSALWTMDYAANSFTLFQVDPDLEIIISSCNIQTKNPTHPAVTSISSPHDIGFLPDGLDWTGSTLWVSSEAFAGNWVVEVDTDCNILQAFQPVVKGGFGTSGVAFDGVDLWHPYPLLSGSGRPIVQTDVAGTETGFSFASGVPVGLEDLACDSVTFAPKSVLWANEATIFLNNRLIAYEIPHCLREESVTHAFSSAVTTQTYSYDGGNHTFTVTFEVVVNPFNLTITAVDTPPSQVALDPNVFPPGTNCFPYRDTSGLCVVYRAETPLPIPGPNFTGSFEILIKYFDPATPPDNPRMAHDFSGIPGLEFTEDMTTAFFPSLDPDTDPALRGRTINWSRIVNVDLATTDPANFIGFLQPLGAGGKVFKSGRTIPVQFQLTDATTGAFITDAVARISVAKISNGTVGPLASDAEASGAANTDNLFRLVGDKYIYNLSTRGFTPGTYLLTVISTKFLPQTVTFVSR